MNVRTLYCVIGVVAVLFTLCSSILADDRPIVVLRVDDCCANLLAPYDGLGGSSALAYMKQKSIPVTFAVITDRADSNSSGFLRWSDLRDYLDHAGGEVASHSAEHVAMPSMDAYINELSKSKAAIVSQGFSCSTFIQPGVWTGNAYINTFAKLNSRLGLAIQNTYDQSQEYVIGGWPIGSLYYKHGMLVSYAIDYSPTVTIPRSLALLDLASQTPGLTYVVTFHGVQESGGTDSHSVQADVLRAYTDRLADLRDQGKIRLLSMNDAYHAQHSSTLNLVADPGFELSQPEFGNDGPWQATAPAGYYVDTGGINNSRYAVTAGWGLNGSVPLGPGRYRMSWSQRPQPGTSSKTGLRIGLLSYTSEGIRYDRCSFPNYMNSDASAWERHSILFKMDYGLAKGLIQFAPLGSGAYGVDDVSVVAEPIDPAVSPSGTSGVVDPAGVDIAWLTPADPSVVSVAIGYDSNTNPMTPGSGPTWRTVSAQSGAWQHLVLKVPWPSQNYMFFSVFAIRNDGSYSPPDLFDVRIDKSMPSTPTVSVAAGKYRTIKGTWSSMDTVVQSGVYSYLYAIGTSAGADDLVHWTSTTSTSSSINVPQTSVNTLYLSVKAQNTYGYWSDVSSASFIISSQPTGLGSGVPDGSAIDVCGTVTAVFADCVYIQDSHGIRGLRVEGTTGYHEGDAVEVIGVLSTKNGERVLTVAQ